MLIIRLLKNKIIGKVELFIVFKYLATIWQVIY